MIPQGAEAATESALQEFSKDSRVKILVGGPTRLETTQISIADLMDQESVIIHDGVRPNLSSSTLEEVIESLNQFDVIDVCIPIFDTILQVENQTAKKFLDRTKVWRGQTPQAFKVKWLRKAWQSYAQMQDKPTLTCDASLVKFIFPDLPIRVVPGTESNLKITVKEDLDILNNLLFNRRPPLLTGIIDSKTNTFEDSVSVVIGGHSGIGKEIVERITELGGISLPVSRRSGFDGSHLPSVEEYFKSIFVKYGKIDFVFVTSGFLRIKSFVTMTEDEILNTLNANLISHIHASRAAYQYLEMSSGSLVLFSSSSYSTARENYVLYSSAKAMVSGLVQGLATEWEGKVRVNAVFPARTKTEMRTIAFGEEPEDTLLSPKHVAYEACELALSDQSGIQLHIPAPKSKVNLRK